MDAAPFPAPPQPPPGNGAWPRSAQLAAAFLLGGAVVLLVVHAYGRLGWGSRPTELEPGHAPAHRIDLNHADRAELLQLPNVGANTADHIEAYRRDHGRFRSVEDLGRVHGIGSAKLAALRPWVCVEDGDDEDEAETPSAPANKAAAGKRAPTKKVPPSEPLDLNTATAAELRARLPDIGPTKSQAIVDERARAPFKSVDDLRRVHGIGPKTVDKLRPYVTVKGEAERVATRE